MKTLYLLPVLGMLTAGSAVASNVDNWEAEARKASTQALHLADQLDQQIAESAKQKAAIDDVYAQWHEDSVKKNGEIAKLRSEAMHWKAAHNGAVTAMDMREFALKKEHADVVEKLQVKIRTLQSQVEELRKKK